MAPTDTANPRKRKQPAFKPPRPTTTDGGVSKSKSKSKGSASTRRSNVGSIFNEGPRNSKAKPKTKAKAKAARQRAVEEEAELEEEEDEDINQDENEAARSLLDDEADASDDGSDGAADEETEADDSASDADMMLAEITHTLPPDDFLAPAIPLPLLHRIMQHSFKTPNETKLSTDARAGVGRYIETFIREGIARCAFEVREKVQDVRSDSALGHDDGWVEVEDLERVGGQLVLDF
jgi:hypothetical protein